MSELFMPSANKRSKSGRPYPHSRRCDAVDYHHGDAIPDPGRVPFERGGRWFVTRNTGLQGQSVLYLMDAPQAEGRVLIDPNLLCADGTVAVAGVSPPSPP
jgi:hypothetical protein